MVARVDVVVLFDAGESDVGHAQFVAGQPIGGSPHREQEHREHFGRQVAPLGGVAAEARNHARLVVVAQIDRRPAVAHGCVPFGVHTLESEQAVRNSGCGIVRLRFVADVRRAEVVEHVELLPFGCDEFPPLFGGGFRAFADGRTVVAGEYLAVHFVQVVVQVRPERVVGEHVRVLAEVDLRKRRVFCDVWNRIQPESIDPLVEPETQNVVDFGPHLGVLPVEVGLLPGEVVQVVGPRGGVVAPGIALLVEMALAVGRVALFLRPPEVVVVVGVFPRGAGLAEPGMLVAGVVQHQVEEKTHASCVCFFQEPVEILHRTEVGHDLPVIADVVAVVGIGRGEDRIEPQGFDSQPVQVVEFFGDSVQVPDTVAVAVLETAGIDLIDDRFFPPGFLQGRGRRSEYGHIVQDSVIRSQDKKKEK